MFCFYLFFSERKSKAWSSPRDDVMSSPKSKKYVYLMVLTSRKIIILNFSGFHEFGFLYIFHISNIDQNEGMAHPTYL